MTKLKCLMSVVFCFLLVSCAPLVFFGAGTAAGVAGFKYYQGALTVIYQAPFIETWDGTLKAFEKMNIKVKRSNHDTTSGKIIAKGANGKSIAVSLKYKSANETEAEIRVGYLGDKEASMAIKEGIRKVLFMRSLPLENSEIFLIAQYPFIIGQKALILFGLIVILIFTILLLRSVVAFVFLRYRETKKRQRLMPEREKVRSTIYEIDKELSYISNGSELAEIEKLKSLRKLENDGIYVKRP